ncbi:hypothetical protein [Rubritalea tangerina]|uniref:hypothetical protein n=1 Tax=Rubritalea tangerina TaxID=430798 RepID=UPI00360915DA
MSLELLSKINWAIDIADLITILLMIVGGIIAYFLIDRNSKADSRFAVIETLANNVKNISPGLKVHYTNQLSKDRKHLYFKVYVKNISDHDVSLPIPQLQYISSSGEATAIASDDLLGFGSMLAPGADLFINLREKRIQFFRQFHFLMKPKP